MIEDDAALDGAVTEDDSVNSGFISATSELDEELSADETKSGQGADICVKRDEEENYTEQKGTNICEQDVLSVPEDEIISADELNAIGKVKPKESLKNKSYCKLCDTRFPDFSRLLNHITFKHFQTELNKIITKSYPGSLGKGASIEEECQDCGQRITTKTELRHHLGVEHNVLWDIYLKKVQTSRKTNANSCPTSFPKQTNKCLNKKNSPSKTKEKVNNSNKDPKLNQLVDENPYSKQFIFGNKKRNISTRKLDMTTEKSDLLTTIAFNVAASLQEPYCSICQLLLDPETKSKLGQTQTNSLEKVPQHSSVWVPLQTLGKTSEGLESKISPLIVCRRCKLCVHQRCYNSPSIEPDNWTCDGCNQQKLCSVCHRPGGCLRMNVAGGVTHITCAMLIPEAVISNSGEIDTRPVPNKRALTECLICGGTGQPVVHCHASRECGVVMHPACGLANHVDIVIGAFSGFLIMRCSYCVEKYGLSKETQETKYPDNDLEKGERVTIVRQDGEKSLGIVIDITHDDYMSVAFDDGTYCDSLEPHSVTFSSLEETENCPVSVQWEGGTYTGIFKGSHKLYWYKIQTVDKLDILELERSSIIKSINTKC